MNAEALALRSIAKNERDHHNRVELSNVIAAAADSIERLENSLIGALKERDLWRERALNSQPVQSN